MDRLIETPPEPPSEHKKSPEETSAFKAMITWLVETDREYRVAQTLVEKTYRRF
jgi:hypothetical protein